MLKSTDLNKEIEQIEQSVVKEKDLVLVAQVKAMALILKMLRDIRSNQVLMMQSSGVEMAKQKSSVVVVE